MVKADPFVQKPFEHRYEIEAHSYGACPQNPSPDFVIGGKRRGEQGPEGPKVRIRYPVNFENYYPKRVLFSQEEKGNLPLLLLLQ